MIDPRGALRNIESVNCTQAAQYICEFEKKPLGCLGDILDVSTKPYFKVCLLVYVNALLVVTADGNHS